MNKVWKIGTSIQSYIDEMIELKRKHGRHFKIMHKNNGMILEFGDGHVVKKTKSTCSQFMRVLISLKIITGDVPYRYDRSVLMDTEYEINDMGKDDESLGEYLNIILNEKIQAIFKNGEKEFPSEDVFIFSLAGTIASLINKENSKYINMKLEGSKIEDVNSYYSKTANLIIENEDLEILKANIEKYIVGMNENMKTIINSIDNKSSKYKTEFYSKKNLKNSLITEPLTFGMFVNSYFTEKTFISIPIYQRKYIWKKETLKTLMNDIGSTEKYNTHYIGNVVVKRKNDGNSQIYRIVDGQQRITTLFIIARALLDFSKYKKFEVDSMIDKKLSIYEEGEDNFINRTFIRIDGNSDYEAFKQVMKGEAFNKKNIPSQIIENYKSSVEWFSFYLQNKGDVDKYWDNLMNSLIFVLINAEGSEEYKLFEKLNTGAVPLTTLELFKNYVLDAFDEKIIDEKIAQQLFEENIDSKFVGRNKSAIAEKFMISYLRVDNSIISDETIFNQFKSAIEQKYLLNDYDTNLEYVLVKLGKEIELYNTISNYKEYTKKDSFAYLYSDFLFMLDGRSIYYPLIIKLIKNIFNDYEDPQIEEINYFREFLRIIEIFEVRFQVASYRGQSLSSKIESILLEVDDSTTPKQLWDIFAFSKGTTGMPSVNELYDTLKNSSIANKPARLIMTRLENYFHMKKGWKVDKEDHTFIAMYSKPSQREHLLPTKWKEHWGEYLESYTEKTGEDLDELINKYINYIGNAFPIPAWSNNNVKNNSLKVKIKKFNKTNYAQSIYMFNGVDGYLEPINDNFGPQEIKERSEKIAEIAKEIWRDYK